MSKYKVGDIVLLDPTKCTERDRRGFSSTGTCGKYYKITRCKAHFGNNIIYYLEGANWHKEEWLSFRHTEVLIGGKLL